MPTVFVPGPCCGSCGTTLNTLKSAKNHWTNVHRAPHPYANNQGQRELRPILDQWRALPQALPAYAKGIEALKLAYTKKLHQSTLPFISTSITDSFSTKPNWDHVISNIISDHNSGAAVISSVDSLAVDDAYHYSVTKSLFYSLQHDFTEEQTKLFTAALDIRPGTALGLKSCKLLVDGRTSSYGVPAQGRNPDLSMAVTTAGHITEVHQDGIWDASILIQLLGEKIIFTWPPTPTNLNLAAKCHRSDKSWLLNAIQHLEEGKMTHLTPGCKIFLPQGELHAVLSLTPSALAGYRVHHPSCITDIPRLLRWDVETSLANHKDHELLNEIINEHDDLLRLWLNQRDPSIERYEQDLITINNLWERDLRGKIKTRLIDLSRPAKRARR